ncbi:PAS domain-containing protein [Actinoplanes sp. NPDC051343]|uniref:PAS domain-containing protein n=1 Tax=Actinoplanes sp. NPDC051343 TaxID=3363906 RepID=UPI0037ABDB42
MLRAIEWILLGSASTTAIIAGAWWRRPARFLPWILLASAIACMGIGDVFYACDLGDAAEYFYLAMFVMVAAALVQFTRGGSLLVDRARLIDLLAWACSTLLVIWVFIIGATHEGGKISAADVIGDLLLSTVAMRLVMAAGRNPSAKLLLSGAVGMLISDIVYPLAPGPFTEIGYIVLYVAWGVAALHPSMTGLTQPMPPRPQPWRGRWAALLGASVATPPLVLLYEAIRGDVRDGVVIAVAGAITLTLAITRLADSVTLSTQALNRERGLRTASAALVAAVDPPAVDEAVRSAVTELLPAAAVRNIVFAADDRQLLAEALPGAGGPSDRSGHRSWWLQDPQADEATLVCPLWLEPLAVARPGGGALVLTGRRDDLVMARDALEVLAGQAALALDRISLVEAVGRRDSDLYLRAVIRNTADMMLVIDEDLRIRYASPALRSLLDQDELSPLATLGDLVHPDDRGLVRRALLASGDGTVFCALRRADHTQVYVEMTYRDLRADRLVQGFVLTLRDVSKAHHPVEQMPHLDHVDELPAWVNRRSAQHKFRY